MNISKKDIKDLIAGAPDVIEKYNKIMYVKCAVCGEVFENEKRTDRKYCDKCVLIGAQKKMESDPRYVLYRMQYKKRYARMGNGKMSASELKEWDLSAKTALADIRNNNIGLDEYWEIIIK
jgi:hypothetical protein